MHYLDSEKGANHEEFFTESGKKVTRNADGNQCLYREVYSLAAERSSQFVNQQSNNVDTWTICSKGKYICCQSDHNIIKHFRKHRTSLWIELIWQVGKYVLYRTGNKSSFCSPTQPLHVYWSWWNINKNTKTLVANRPMVAEHVGGLTKAVLIFLCHLHLIQCQNTWHIP